MKNYLNFIKLDLITIKPYITIKNFLIFGISAFLVMFGSKTSATALGILMGFGTLYVTYPFAVGEKNGIDSLYIFLGINRETVVIGRYLYALVIDLAFCLFGFLLTGMITLILSIPFNLLESLAVMLVLFIFFSFSQLIQLPIYFKNGYSKARVSAYLPFLIVPVLVVIFGQLYPAFPELFDTVLGWVTQMPMIPIILIVIIWLVGILISIKQAQKHYQKREF